VVVRSRRETVDRLTPLPECSAARCQNQHRGERPKRARERMGKGSSCGQEGKRSDRDRTAETVEPHARAARVEPRDSVACSDDDACCSEHHGDAEDEDASTQHRRPAAVRPAERTQDGNPREAEHQAAEDVDEHAESMRPRRWPTETEKSPCWAEALVKRRIWDSDTPANEALSRPKAASAECRRFPE